MSLPGRRAQQRKEASMSIRETYRPATLTAVALAVSLAGGEVRAQAGLLTGGAVELAPIRLSSGQPLADAPYEL